MKTSDTTLESGHENWYLMDTNMVKEVAYMEFHQAWGSSTQTATSTWPITWIKVSRLNMMVHHLVIGHWSIPLISARYPTNNDNGNQGTEWNLKSANRCVKVKHLKESIDKGTLNVLPKLSMARGPAADGCKSQGTKWTLYSYSKINDMNSMEWNRLEGGN